MPSDLQVSNIKDLTNANSAISIASDGQVTISQNNPTVTLHATGDSSSTNTTFPAGHVLQVIRGTSSNNSETFNSATPAGSAIYVDITPIATSSKIYLSASVGIDTIGTNNAWIAFYRKVGSGSFENIGENGSTYDGHYYINPISGRHLDGASMVYLDSPTYTLTNTIRYALYVGTQGSSCQLRHDLQTPSIIAMEVKV